jgi:diguanylate cyclase (GGDEF)-like protein/PAS domain S-box-containing protein
MNPLISPEARESPIIHLSADFIRVKEYFEAIVASTSDAICTTDIRGRLMYFSPGAEQMLGFRSTEVIGRPAHQFYAGGHEEAERVMRLLKKTGRLKSHEVILKTKDGKRVHVSMSASLLRDRTGRVMGTIGISKDITQRVELENKLREMSITDNLTGLYNQRHFHERLENEASRAKRQRYKLSMILVDLDGFKQANDAWGHLEGDRILRAFAGAIDQSIRKEVDSAFRYGGDEFVVLLPGLGAERAAAVMERIGAAARARIARGGVGFSYGIATLTASQSLADFVKAADKKMFAMKAKHKKLARSGESAIVRAVAPRLSPPHRV